MKKFVALSMELESVISMTWSNMNLGAALYKWVVH